MGVYAKVRVKYVKLFQNLFDVDLGWNPQKAAVVLYDLFISKILLMDLNSRLS